MREDGKEDEDGAEELAGGGRGGVISDAGPEDYRSAVRGAAQSSDQASKSSQETRVDKRLRVASTGGGLSGVGGQRARSRPGARCGWGRARAH